MTLNDYSIFFDQQLETIYDTEERKALLAIVMDEVLHYSRADMFLKKNEKLSSEIETRLQHIAMQLRKEIPIQYIFHKAYFYGYTFNVNPATLIPRKETEELVEWILETMRRQPGKKWKVLDIGTGSGCIPITLKKEFPLAEISAIDISPEALSVAKENAQNLNAEIYFIQQNILATNALDTYDIIVSNPPYVRHLEKAEMKNNVLQHEPHLALFVENTDPLIFYRKILQLAENSLTTKGMLFFEINQYLGNEMTELANRYFKQVILKKDLQGNDRMMCMY